MTMPRDSHLAVQRLPIPGRQYELGFVFPLAAMVRAARYADGPKAASLPAGVRDVVGVAQQGPTFLCPAE